MSRPSWRRNPPTTSDHEEVFQQNVAGEGDLETHLRTARETVAALMAIMTSQPQQLERLPDQAPLATHRAGSCPARGAARRQGGEAGSGRDGCRNAEPAVGTVQPTAAGSEEPATLDAAAAGTAIVRAPSREVVPAVWERMTDKPRRMGLVKEFVAAGGDWGAFTRRFEAAYQALDWMEEALKALPTILNDETFATFIPADRRATLQATCHEMAGVSGARCPAVSRGPRQLSAFESSRETLTSERAVGNVAFRRRMSTEPDFSSYSAELYEQGPAPATLRQALTSSERCVGTPGCLATAV
ncbi:unnamed protein product [Lampetra planeri]